MPAHGFRILPPIAPGHEVQIQNLGQLRLNPSHLRPNCHADERLYKWRGVNVPPASVILSGIIQHLADIASRASLRDASSYGSGLRKFHLFCDIFSIPEEQRLPASYALIHSFALWAVADPDPLEPIFADGTPFEPVSVKVA